MIKKYKLIDYSRKVIKTINSIYVLDNSEEFSKLLRFDLGFNLKKNLRTEA